MSIDGVAITRRVHTLDEVDSIAVKIERDRGESWWKLVIHLLDGDIVEVTNYDKNVEGLEVLAESAQSALAEMVLLRKVKES